MASSFVEYRGRGFWSHDDFLAELLQALADAAASCSGQAWLHEAADHWRAQASGNFAGWVHRHFEEYLATDDRRDLVLRLLAAIAGREDASVTLTETCELLQRLLTGDLQTDASSPLDYMVTHQPRHPGRPPR